MIDPQERRGSPRIALQQYGTILFHGRDVPCSLIDVSDTGVRFDSGGIDLNRPDNFALKFGDGEPRACRVVWRSAAAIGASLLEDERVRRLRQTVTRYERLLAAETSVDVAAVYRAEIAAARAMMREIARG